jgi:hypothetical protein
MEVNMRFAALIAGLALFATATPVAQSAGSKQTVWEIERELLGLTSYGVFDYIAFDVERGTVTLYGYSYNNLKADAERAVKRVPGVDMVENKIEQLRASPADDRIRWATFYKIYGDSYLSRYSPGGETAARYELVQSRRFPGLQPFGTHPVHIIVKNGRTTLMGAVDSQMDKRMAEVRAREIPGVFSVENELVIDNE